MNPAEILYEALVRAGVNADALKLLTQSPRLDNYASRLKSQIDLLIKEEGASQRNSA